MEYRMGSNIKIIAAKWSLGISLFVKQPAMVMKIVLA